MFLENHMKILTFRITRINFIREERVLFTSMKNKQKKLLTFKKYKKDFGTNRYNKNETKYNRRNLIKLKN